MEYPKPFMRLAELKSMGLPEQMLLDAYREKGQRFAQKVNPTKKTSPILFDTAAFEKWRMEKLILENKSIPRGRTGMSA